MRDGIGKESTRSYPYGPRLVTRQRWRGRAGARGERDAGGRADYDDGAGTLRQWSYGAVAVHAGPATYPTPTTNDAGEFKAQSDLPHYYKSGCRGFLKRRSGFETL